MRLVLFPTAVGVLVVVAWLLVTLIEECLFHSGDPKFDCRSSLEIAAIIHWEVPIGRAAGMLFFWPIAGFLISGASLILVRRLGRGPS